VAIKITNLHKKTPVSTHHNDLMFFVSTLQRLPFLYFNILIIIIMSSTTSHSLPAPFAMDPVRSSVRSLATEHIQLLHGPHHLSTALVDYLLTSNCTAFFDVMNRGSSPIAAADSKTVQRTRDKYRPYCFKRFHFLAAATTISSL
jgi:hypothetical protein